MPGEGRRRRRRSWIRAALRSSRTLAGHCPVAAAWISPCPSLSRGVWLGPPAREGLPLVPHPFATTGGGRIHGRNEPLLYVVYTHSLSPGSIRAIRRVCVRTCCSNQYLNSTSSHTVLPGRPCTHCSAATCACTLSFAPAAASDIHCSLARSNSGVAALSPAPWPCDTLCLRLSLSPPHSTEEASAIQSESWMTPAPAASPAVAPSADGRLSLGMWSSTSLTSEPRSSACSCRPMISCTSG